MVIPSIHVLVQVDFNNSHLIDLIAIYIILYYYPQYWKVLNGPFLLLDSAQNSMIEATQAYGIEEPSETELQVQVFVATSSVFIFSAAYSYYESNK